MKRSQLIEIGILAVALICGYKFIESLVSIVITTLYQLAYKYDGIGPLMIQYIILLAIYLAGLLLLIRYNKQIATYIDKQGQPLSETGTETVPLRINQKGLLFIILIALCVATLIDEVPIIIFSIYNFFKKEAGGIRNGNADDVKFKVAAIKFTVTLIVLFYATSISSWFSGQLPADKPLVETNSET